MRVTIKFDTLETEYPHLVSEAARSLMLASRGITTSNFTPEDAPSILPDETDTDTEENPVMSSPRSDAVEVSAPRKRGRKSNAEKAAEAAAIEQEVTTAETGMNKPVPAPSTPPPPLFQAVNNTAPPPLFQAVNNTAPVAPVTTSAPPAFTPPLSATAPAAAPAPAAFTPPPSVQPQAPAMPTPPAAVGTSHEFTVEDLRTVTAEANKRRPGSAFQIMRRNTWQDGTEKPSWAVIDMVPADQRERLAGEICSELGI